MRGRGFGRCVLALINRTAPGIGLSSCHVPLGMSTC